MSVLEVHDVSIRYMTGDFKDIGLKEFVMRKLKGEYHVKEFWADKNVSFSLEKGDMLGIIGTNGAGKSTLLKVISGIMEPTGGRVRREGNVAAFLELASGFDGDLTVRENAYLRGAMLGYTRKFMDEKYDQIIDFAELTDFQDRPFKQLSSGMKSRLAFSIASLVEPDILILDEVLSVGDGAFRKKSEEKMREIIASGAATILVSHSLQQVREMCTKVLWLDHGKQVAYGVEVDAICDKYQHYIEGKLQLNDMLAVQAGKSCDGEKKKESRDQSPMELPSCPQKIKLAGRLSMTLIILAELFVMFFMSFPRLDDLTWGSSVGLQRLSTWFAGYNGRYTGNVIVIILTRLPSFVRASVEVIILCVLIYYVHRLLPKKGAFCFFALAFLSLPLSLHAQSIVWTAGYANYVTSAAVMLFVLNVYSRIVIQGKRLSRTAFIIFIIISFLGQLVLENTTFYTIILAAFFLFYGLVSQKKLYAPVAAGLSSAICGAILMFTNSSYHSALVGDGGNYKSLVLMPLELWRKYQNEVVPHLVQNNHLLNLALSIVLLLLWLIGDAGNKKLSRFWRFCGAVLIAFFAYDMADSTWVRMLPHGKTAYAVIALLYAAYVIITICVTITEKADRLTLLIFAGSQIVLAAPLVPASPLSARCFFQNGILWAMLFGYMVQILLERYRPQHTEKYAESKIAVITQIVCASYLAIVLCGQSVSWHIQDIRLEVTQIGIESNAETIILPEVPWSSVYCFGANLSNSSKYWISNYKRYYGIPDDIELQFLDYYKWKAEYGDQKLTGIPEEK